MIDQSFGLGDDFSPTWTKFIHTWRKSYMETPKELEVCSLQ